MKSRVRVILLLTALPLTVYFLNLQTQRLLHDPTILPIDDFVEYWAAGWLNARGQNPYDPDQLLPVERDAGRPTDEAIMMWNPPWTLTLAMPFGRIDSRGAQILWVACSLVFILAGADQLWRLYGGSAEQRWVAWILALSYLPTLFVLNAGQIGGWVLLGIALFLSLERSGWSMLAGASSVLLAIKPHLLYLFWIALIVWGVRNNWRLLFGGLIAGTIASLIPLLFNPFVFTQYWEAFILRPPVQWQSPTIGSLLRMAEGESRFGLSFLPNFFGIAWLIWYALVPQRGRSNALADNRTIAAGPPVDPLESAPAWNWPERMPLLLLVSFVTASYGAWPFDLVILLPAVMQIAAALGRKRSAALTCLGLGFWIVLNLTALVLNLLQIASFWFIWMAPVMLAAYVFLKRRLERE